MYHQKYFRYQYIENVYVLYQSNILLRCMKYKLKKTTIHKVHVLIEHFLFFPNTLKHAKSIKQAMHFPQEGILSNNIMACARTYIYTQIQQRNQPYFTGIACFLQ